MGGPCCIISKGRNVGREEGYCWILAKLARGMGVSGCG